MNPPCEGARGHSSGVIEEIGRSRGIREEEEVEEEEAEDLEVEVEWRRMRMKRRRRMARNGT